MNPENSTVDRKAFIARFMSESGLSYAQACRVYETMCRAFEDGVVTGSKIRIGKLGAIVPIWKPGRDHHMHFRVAKGRKVETGIHRTYHIDGRYTFKFNLYRQFVNTHQLRWFLDMPINISS